MLLTLSSDPRVWMGGGIPTRWRRHNRDGRDGRENRDRRLSFQIACSSLSILAKKSSFLDTCSKKDKQAMGFKVILRPPFYTPVTVGKVLTRCSRRQGVRGAQRTLRGAQRPFPSFEEICKSLPCVQEFSALPCFEEIICSN